MNRREQLFALFEACVCNEEFCNVCPNREQGIVKCDKFAHEVLNMCRDAIEENEALKADMQLMAETRSDCIVCDHYVTSGPKPDCELNGWHCDWKWRGLEKARRERDGSND